MWEYLLGYALIQVILNIFLIQIKGIKISIIEGFFMKY